MGMPAADPHGLDQLYAAGATLDDASSAIIALHGRGADAADIINLAGEVVPPGAAILAPNAAGQTWYPHRFLEPIERNEPYLTSALNLIHRIFQRLGEADIPPGRVALLGFSQGACLALEYAARNARRYGAVVGFSGGLIGPDGTAFAYPGSMEGTPVFLGCSDVDAHIPARRVEETAEVMTDLGAAVDLRIYPGMGHTVNRDEIRAVRTLLAPLGSDG
ncbi:MAG: dienelactone hydrolase family protein [Thermomicrobiales bacterium]|nr:dienelactone hydrolase family protein [Thermomicrobiales bacterium]